MDKKLIIQAIIKFIFGFFIILLLLFIPAGTLIFMLYPVILVKRIRNEEKVLEQGLKGYLEYKNKVKYKLIPFIW